MDALLNRVNAYFENLPDALRRNRLWIWPVLIAVVILTSWGAGRFQLTESRDSYLQAGDSARVAFDRFRILFAGNESMFIIYEARDGDVFSDQSLRAARGVQEELLNYRLALDSDEFSPLDHITDVKTIINTPYLEVRDGALISRQFIGSTLPPNEQVRIRLRQEALAHPDFPGVYFSKDYRYGGILLTTDFNSILEEDSDGEKTGEPGAEAVSADEEESDLDLDVGAEFDVGSEEVEISAISELKDKPKFKEHNPVEYEHFMADIEAIIDKAEYTDILAFYPIGNPVANSFISKVFVKELNLLLFLFMGLLILALIWLFGSLSAVLWPLLIVGMADIMMMGALGWTGASINTMVYIIIYLVIVVGVADSVHVLSGYLFFRNQGEDHQTALRSVFKKSGMAIFLTSFTTSIGMLSLIFVEIVPIQTLGIFSAVGVTFAFLITVVALPLMLDLWSPFSKRRAKKIAETGPRVHFIQKILLRVEPISYSRPKAVVLGFLAVSVVMAYGASKIQVDNNVKDLFPADHIITQALNLIDEKMGGASNMEILVETGRTDGMKDPRILKAMESLQDYIEIGHGEWVTRTFSLANVARETNRVLNEGRREMARIPTDSHLAEQILFLFNNANPRDRRQLVTDNYDMGRITIRLRVIGSKPGTALINDVESAIERIFAPLRGDYPDLSVTLTGGLAIRVRIINYISTSQLKSFGSAMLVISLIFFVIFASKRVGFIAFIANVYPILFIFGVMGYFNIRLDTDTLLAAPMTIGIIVDDTIHFLTHYRAELQKHGDITKAIKETFREAGQAITFTTIILALAFLSMLYLTHQGLAHFGMLSAISFTMALISDLFLLPSLCILFNARFKGSADPAQSAPAAA